MLACSCGISQDKEETKEKPKTEVQLGAANCYLGKLSIGETKTFSLSLKNVGENVMIIENVVTSCGCTKISVPKQPVLPTQSIEIKGEFTAQEKGIVQKQIIIYTNTKKSPLYFLVIGEVQ